MTLLRLYAGMFNCNEKLLSRRCVDSTLERTQQDVRDSLRRGWFSIAMAGSGAVSLLIGLWLWLHFS